MRSSSYSNRKVGDGCPYISGKAVWPGYIDFATKNPKLAKEWLPTRNGNLNPTDVTKIVIIKSGG